MDNIYNEIWKNVKIASNFVKNTADETIEFDEIKKGTYINECKKLITVVNKYMNDSSDVLDRHKMAAIIIIAIIKAKPLICKQKKEDSIFVANYVIATEVGLAYMKENLNKILESIGEKLIDKYFFPKSWTCSNDYFKVFYRNLYFTDKNENWEFNPLDIAEKLFLLEYITLLKNGINPKKLETTTE